MSKYEYLVNGEELDELQRKYDTLLERTTWISVEDRLPEDDKDFVKFLVCKKFPEFERSFVGIEYFESGKFSSDTQRYITHWMPLPDVPEVSDD